MSITKRVDQARKAVVRPALSTDRKRFRSGLETLAVEGLSVGVLYVVGYLLRGLGAVE